jgi:hypothetical protein
MPGKEKFLNTIGISIKVNFKVSKVIKRNEGKVKRVWNKRKE